MTTVREQLEKDHSPMSHDSAGAAIAAAPTSVVAPADGSNRIKSSNASNPQIMAIIPEFVDGLPSKVRKMTDLLERDDLPALQRVAHELLGTCGGYGFAPVSQPARTVEQSIKAGQPLESIIPAVKSLIEVIRRIEGYDESKEAVLPMNS